MRRKTINVDDFLNKVAESMGVKVVTWNTVEESIDKNISFGMIVNIDKYFTEDEKDILRQKTFIGGIVK